MTDPDPYGDPTRIDVPVTQATPSTADPTQALPVTPGGPPPGGPPPVMGPPPGGGDRGWWILGGLLALVLLIGLAALLLGGDDDEAADATTTTSTTEATTTTSSTTTTEATTTTAAPTTTEAPPPTVAPAKCVSGAPDDPSSSVEVMYEAFTLDDRDCAEKLATTDAVDALFAIPGDGSDWVYQGCTEEEVPDPHLNCAYTFPGGATHFRTSYNDVDGWVIYEVFQTTD
mgnify:CR=1 FL=1